MIDHLGRKFNSFPIMCREWGKSPEIVRHRLKIGWSLREALEVTTSRHNTRYIAEKFRKVIGLNGKRYSNVKELLEREEIARAVFALHLGTEEFSLRQAPKEEIDYSVVLEDILRVENDVKGYKQFKRLSALKCLNNWRKNNENNV